MDFMETIELSLEIIFILLFSISLICQIVNCIVQIKYLRAYLRINKSLLEEKDNENNSVELVVPAHNQDEDEYYSSVEEI